MKRRAAAWMGLVGVIVGLGCAPSVQTIRPAPPELAHFGFYLARVDTHDNCQRYFDSAFRQAIIRDLIASGFSVTEDGAAPHHVRLGYQFTATCAATGNVEGTIQLRAERAGEVLMAPVSYLERCTANTCHANDQANHASSEFVNALGESPRLIELAKSKPPPLREGDAVAAAAPAPAETTPAASPVPAAASAPPDYAIAIKRGAPQPTAYALVVGVEKYRDVQGPVGARFDAERFGQLAATTLGVPQDHLVQLLDANATKTDLEKRLAWLQGNVPKGGRVYFFFAGHGAPDAAKGTAYLLPYDGDPKYLDTTAVKLSTVLGELGKTQAKEVLAFVDACFSGAGGRSVLPPGARPLVRVTDAGPGPGNARVSLLSSSGPSEISGPLPGKPVGLFTHVLTQAIGTGAADYDGDGTLTLKEIAEWVKPRVAREAKKDNREQTPALYAGTDAGDGSGLFVTSGLAP